MRGTRYFYFTAKNNHRQIFYGSHTFQTGSDSRMLIIQLLKPKHSCSAAEWVLLHSSSLSPHHPTMLNTSMQPLLCAGRPLCLEVWGGNKQISSQISRSTYNPPSIRHSSKCPWLSHISTLLHTVVCGALSERMCHLQFSKLSQAKTILRGLNDWLSNEKLFALNMDRRNKKRETQRELQAVRSHKSSYNKKCSFVSDVVST